MRKEINNDQIDEEQKDQKIEERRIYLDDGKSVLVPKELYDIYRKNKRHEKYLIERYRAHGVISLDALDSKMISNHGASIYDIIASNDKSIEEQVFTHMMIEKLYHGLSMLSESERSMIITLFYGDESIREFARKKGVSHTSIIKWRNQVLKELKFILEIDE